MIEVIFFFTFFFAFSNIFGILFKGLCYCIQLLHPIFPSTIIWNFSSYLTIKLLPFIYQHIFLSWWSIHMTPLLVWFSSLPVIISDYFSYVSRILHPLSPTRCISLFLIWNFIRWNYYFSFILLSMAGDEDQTYTRNACLMHCPTLPKMIDLLLCFLEYCRWLSTARPFSYCVSTARSCLARISLLYGGPYSMINVEIKFGPLKF